MIKILTWIVYLYFISNFKHYCIIIPFLMESDKTSLFLLGIDIENRGIQFFELQLDLSM